MSEITISKNLLIGFFIGVAVTAIIGYIFMGSSQSNDTEKDETTKNTNINSVVNTNSKAAAPSGSAKVDIEVSAEDHVRGDENAAITIVEFSDLQCPYCASFHTTMKQVIDNYEGQVKWVYKHFPIASHPYAQEAAEASECAGDQGKFWEYTDELFENQSAIDSTYLKQAAADLSLNTSEFEECLDSGKFSDRVKADYQEGLEAGVTGTPGGFINGEKLGGAVPYSQLKVTIDSLL